MATPRAQKKGERIVHPDGTTSQFYVKLDGTEIEVKRDAHGKLMPGYGAVGGRKPGTSQADLVRKLIEPKRQEIIERLFDALKSEDQYAATRAAEMLLRYLVPPQRHQAELITVPGLAEANTLHDRAKAVIAAVAVGEVSPEAGQKVLAMLDVLNRTASTVALEARIAALEGRKAQEIEVEVLDGGDTGSAGALVVIDADDDLL